MDTLRYVLVLAVVVLHAVEPQMTVENDWAVDDPRTTPLADQIVVFLDIMLMSLLFFIAGYFTVPTMIRRGIGGFWRRKFWSLAVPGAVVVVLLNPVWKYVYHLTRAWSSGETPMGYGEAWWFFLSSVRWFETGNIHSFNFSLLHVWFITLLLVFYIPVTVYFARRQQKGKEANGPSPAAISPKKLVRMLIVIHLLGWIITSIGMLSGIPPLQWTVFGPFLLFQPVRLPQYIIYFGLGLYAFRSQWFSQGDLFGPTRYWPWVFIAATLGHQAWVQYMIFNPVLLEFKLSFIASGFLRYCVCASSLVLLLQLGLRYWNSPHRIHRHLAKNSYHFYLLHPAIVVLIQFGFLLWANLNWWATLVGTVAFSLIGTYLISVCVGSGSNWCRQAISSYRGC